MQGAVVSTCLTWRDPQSKILRATQGVSAAPGMARGKITRGAGELSGGNVPPVAGRAGASVDRAELDSR